MRDVFDAAARNHGVITTADLDRAGLSDWARRRLVATGVIDRVVPGVYRFAGVARSPEQLLAQALAEHPGDQLVARRSAASLWGVPGYPPLRRPDLLAAEDGGRRSRLSTLHTSSVILEKHRSSRDGFPVTSAARTAFDLAAVDRPGRVERAVDHLLVRRLVTLADLDAVLSVLGGRGRPGTVAFRVILEARGAGYVAPASELERIARRLFSEAGLPEPSFEVDLGDGSWIARVDCLWRDAQLVVELDGRRFHDGRSKLADDRRRDNQLVASGWRVLRFTWDDLTRRPAEVVATIRAALAV